MAKNSKNTKSRTVRGKTEPLPAKENSDKPKKPVTNKAANTRKRARPSKARKAQTGPDWPEPTLPGWEANLKAAISKHPEKVEEYLRNRFGVPDDFDSTKLVEYAIRRANSSEPHQFVEELKNGIHASGT